MGHKIKRSEEIKERIKGGFGFLFGGILAILIGAFILYLGVELGYIYRSAFVLIFIGVFAILKALWDLIMSFFNFNPIIFVIIILLISLIFYFDVEMEKNVDEEEILVEDILVVEPISKMLNISHERAEALRRGVITPENSEEEAIVNCVNDSICSEVFLEYPFCVEGDCVECKKNSHCSGEEICFDDRMCVECYLDIHCEDNEVCSRYKCQEIPKTIELRYCRHGVKGTREYISLDVYKNLNDRLIEIDRSISYYVGEEAPNEKDYLLKFIDNEEQLQEIKKLALLIEDSSNLIQERARIAITLVQMLPYDNKAKDNIYSHISRYPYEVLFDKTGICGEKSRLILMLLREIGFGSAYIIFPDENHAVAGIKCPKNYSFKNTGYCFVESTDVIEIGLSDLSYVDVGHLDTVPQIIEVSEGYSYDDIKIKYDQYMEGVEDGTHLLITDKYGNKKIRLGGADYMDLINNPDVMISYGDNTVEYVN